MGIVIIKAAISVFICCLIYLFFDIGTGAPFYSAIAAVICLQPEIKSTFLWGRRSGCWISRAKEPNQEYVPYRAEPDNRHPYRRFHRHVRAFPDPGH